MGVKVTFTTVAARSWITSRGDGKVPWGLSLSNESHGPFESVDGAVGTGEMSVGGIGKGLGSVNCKGGYIGGS